MHARATARVWPPSSVERAGRGDAARGRDREIVSPRASSHPFFPCDPHR
ncbi:hypothetical protein DB32_007682 [Sandaracinus amylolyticus]|uniref:Uncharacterized protein n=1 Tax=Sandaracinus amylolyticus TaxID=927083 RepID=A0A0F6W965_9BACT|nr:hypothetical protein DB32_007682 [Sandaracinus amylolyticus]